MAVKSFKIKLNGKKEIIEYEDDLTFGEIESILSRNIDLTDPSKPKVNIPQYRMDILCKVIKTAPFKTGDAVTIRNLKSATVAEIISGVMKDYPLGKFLQEWVMTFAGSLDENENDMTSTTS